MENLTQSTIAFIQEHGRWGPPIVFPGEPSPITLGNVQKAIAVFEATLITPNAPFDRFLQGDQSALSAVQKEGLALFIDRDCASCHNGINVGGGMYAVVLLSGCEFCISRTVGGWHFDTGTVPLRSYS